MNCVFILLLLLLALILSSISHFQKKKFPFPTAREGLPFLGPLIAYRRNPRAFFARQRNKIGNCFFVDLIVLKFIFLGGPKGNEIQFKSPDTDLSLLEAMKQLFPSMFDTPPEFKDWSTKINALVNSGINNQSSVDYWTEEMAPVINRHLSLWVQNSPILLFECLHSFIMEVMITVIFGNDVYLNHVSQFILFFREYEAAIQTPVIMLLPYTWTSAGRAILRLTKFISEIVTSESEKRIKNPDKYNERKDYLQHALNRTGTAYLADNVLVLHLIGLTIASIANLNGVLGWTLLHAQASNSTYKKLQSNPDNKTFIEACTRETARLYSGLLVIRKSTKDISIPDWGVTIPKGYLTVRSPLEVHMREEIWGEDAAEWKPERMLDPNTFKKRLRSMEFVQFG